MRERGAITLPGLLMVVVTVALFVVGSLLVVEAAAGTEPAFTGIALGVGLIVLAALASSGFVVLQPNTAAVITFLGTTSARSGTMASSGRGR